MKIYPIINKSLDKNNVSELASKVGHSSSVSSKGDMDYFANASQVPFAAIHKIKLKKVDIDIEKPKLVKQISDILEDDISDLDIEDFYMNAIAKLRERYRLFQQRQQELWDKLEALDSDATIDASRKARLLLQYKGEFEGLKKFRFTTPTPPVKKTDDRTDYQLLNKFKSALIKDDFNLRRVHSEHYADLKDVQTLDELHKKYPQIKIPPRPEEVVAGKMVDILTRDFYLEVNKMAKNGDRDGVFELCESRLAGFIDKIKAKFGGDVEVYRDNLVVPFVRKIANVMKDNRGNGFNSIPENRKLKDPVITKADVDLLHVDFDDFVLSVLQRQYLGSEKLNDIVYERFGRKIPLKTLSNTEYKMDKSSEKIKQILLSGDRMLAAQRDYDNFNPAQLKAALGKLSTKDLSDNEQIFNTLVSFETCRFTPEDYQQIRKLLRVADDVNDCKISVEEAVDVIQKENITPSGTEKLNKIEDERIARELREEQQKLRRLSAFQDEFDGLMNVLYKNNLNAVASSSAKYRPIDLEGKDSVQAKYLMKLIRQSMDGDSDTIPNRLKLERTISRWNTYNYYITKDSSNPVFKKALDFATQDGGSVDINKAGQYIMNAEIVNGYPETLSIVEKPEVLQRIMDKVKSADEAIKYLSKFEDYETLMPSEKNRLSQVLEKFDMKDVVDKQILKHIIENDYVAMDTAVMAKLNDKSDELTEVVFASPAKQQILEKYKFPLCMEYLEGFEGGLSQISSYGSTGIKHMGGGSNRSLEHKMELKLSGHDDRLFSSQNDYVFDIFSEHGMH